MFKYKEITDIKQMYKLRRLAYIFSGISLIFMIIYLLIGSIIFVVGFGIGAIAHSIDVRYWDNKIYMFKHFKK